MITAPDIGTLYERLMFHLFKGEIRSPRGMPTIEMPNTHLLLENARENVLVSPVRNLNYRFMVAEWVWIMSGLSDVASLTRYNKKMAEFSDDGVTLSGAYGPRIRHQLPYVLKKLKSDPDTRQAVITIWTPSPADSKDIPCTVSLQFLLRDGRLNLIVTMRSSDAWLGIPYDIFSFSQLQNYVASLYLGIEIGWLAMNLGSSHLYEQHFEAAREIIGSGTIETITSPRLNSSWPSLLTHALVDEDCGEDELINEPWLTYGKVLCSKSSQEALEHLYEANDAVQVR